jgi:hypothetical protein
MTQQEITAQLAHIGWGGFLTLLAAVFLPMEAAVAVAAAIAAIKESAESFWGVWEAKQTWSSSFIDFACFLIGIAIAVAIAAFHH